MLVRTYLKKVLYNSCLSRDIRMDRKSVIKFVIVQWVKASYILIIYIFVHIYLYII